MPRRDDLHKILVLGSGPIVIGQAAEFDYSGAQACKVLLEEGYEVVLVNSNPATIMTDPEFATATYVEPLLPEVVAQVIERERPDALLPTLGGQTALNLAKALYEDGTLERFGVELIGANYDAINRAEDRELFDATMQAAGLRTARNTIATSLDEARAARSTDFGLPLIIRPAFTLGGRGGGIARTEAEFEQIVAQGLAASPIGQVLIDESVLGWGEFELEVMRDRADNVVIVCSIENVDPMGVHTGDSVTVAPQMSLTDRLYQKLRDQAIAVIRAVGVETGGSNVQFAVNPATDEIVVIEMNPRVSRSSALASKATGFPIAKIAARLAVGYTLDEIPNDITRKTPASFEPTIDYVVVKWPRFAFEKFPGVDARLSTHMKSVGEVMAIGRTFKQAFAKAMRSRELDAPADLAGDLLERLETPGADRFDVLLEAFRQGATRGRRCTRARRSTRGSCASCASWRSHPEAVEAGVRTYRAVDTCAAEFAAETPYFYSAWERPPAAARGPARRPAERDDPRLGPEPDRPGDRVRLLLRARRDDRARVRPRRGDGQLQPGDGLDRLRHLRPAVLRAADARGRARDRRGRAARGRDRPVRRPDAAQARGGAGGGGRAAARHVAEAIDLAEDRGRFGALLERLGLKAPPYATAHGRGAGARGRAAASASRCSCGRATCSAAGRWSSSTRPTRSPTTCAGRARGRRREIFLDRFLENAIEVDVDAICDGEDVWIGGIMQHVEEAGIHSGDSACVLPPHSLGREMLREIREATTRARARARRGRADERAVRRARRRPLRDRGQPARVADRAVRVQGDRAAAGQDRLPGDARRAARRHGPARRPAGGRPRLGQGGGAAVRPLRRRRTRCSGRRCARPAR